MGLSLTGARSRETAAPSRASSSSLTAVVFLYVAPTALATSCGYTTRIVNVPIPAL